MRIGIDGRYIQDQYHGIGRYTFEVTQALAGNYPDHQLFVFYNPALTNTRFDLTRLETYPNVTLVKTKLHLFWPQQQLVWPRLLRRHRIELFHSPYFDAPLLAPCPVVITIHDLIFDRYPEYMPQRHFRVYYRLMMRLVLQRAARIISISEATRQELISLYMVNPEKISVTPLATAPAYQPVPTAQAETVRTRYQLPARFALTVGTRRPHKNVAALIKAFAVIAPHTDAMLVLAGQADSRWPDDVTPLIEQFNLQGRVIQPGHITETDMPALYSLADVFVFPSLVEGFGLPPLEAMACGTAVIASNTASLPEVVAEAGILVDPHDVSALSRALLVTLQKPAYRKEFERLSLLRAAQFNWPRTARLTLDAYEAALVRRKMLQTCSSQPEIAVQSQQGS